MSRVGTVAVVGGGPAGLHAADLISRRGQPVQVFEGMPSVGRKLLVAGRGGLNLSKDEPRDRMAMRYTGQSLPPTIWPALLEAFDTAAVRRWAEELGIPTFVGTSQRIYPEGMKAAPLLRRLVQRLRAQQVEFRVRHRLTGLRPGPSGPGLELEFTTPEGLFRDRFEAVVLALGGGSWPQTGSDGQWVGLLRSMGIEVVSLQSANAGWEVDWKPEVAEAGEGQPVKNLVVRAGETRVAGELLITRYGLEGGSLYQLGAELRCMDAPELIIDFKPTYTPQNLVGKMAAGSRTCLAAVRSRLKLSAGAHAILSQVLGGEVWYPTLDLAERIKECHLPLRQARPLAEAISSAGGVAWTGLTANLMIRQLPGVFVAGEMIDWEAPTGGYLVHGSLATATRAADGVRQWLANP